MLRLLHLGWMLLAIGVLASACGRSSPESPQIRGNSLALFDARSNDIVADVPVGGEPSRVVYVDGAFWVVSPEAGLVFRVDTDTKAATRFHIGEHPYDLASGGGGLWIPDHDGQRLIRFDLVSHELRQTRSFGLPAISVGFGFGSVWLVVADGRLLRIDPRTLRQQGSIPEATTAIESSEPKLAFDRRSIWISSPAEGNVARIDPEDGSVDKRILPGATGISAGAGAVWVADDDSSIWRFAGGRSQRVEVGAQPHDVAATHDSIWVAEYRAVRRLDPDNHDVVATVKLPHYPVAVAAGGGFVAVAVRAGTL